VDRRGATQVVAENLGFPNGVVLRPGGELLLVGESLYNRILEFRVSAPGKVGAPRVFASLPPRGESQPDDKPDGMALDAAGNLYVAHYGMGHVQVLDPQGKLLASLSGAGIFTSNVAFGGPNMSSLYVTGSIGPTEQTTGMLVRLDLPWVKGLRILPVAP
jgi:gluconolactonase